MHPLTAQQYNTGLVVTDATKEIFKTKSNVQNYWAISCGDHCMSSNPNWWRLVPNTAREKISARDMAIQTRDGAVYKKPGMLGRVVTDECRDYNCGCIGQSTSMFKLTQNTLFFKMMERVAPGMSMFTMIEQKMPGMPFTLPLSTAIAADIWTLSP